MEENTDNGELGETNPPIAKKTRVIKSKTDLIIEKEAEPVSADTTEETLLEASENIESVPETEIPSEVQTNEIVEETEEISQEIKEIVKKNKKEITKKMKDKDKKALKANAKEKAKAKAKKVKKSEKRQGKKRKSESKGKS